MNSMLSKLKKVKGAQRVALITGSILLIPIIGRWPWGILDFVAMGLIIFVTGMILDWISRNVDKKYQLIAGAAVLFVFFVIWAELAVDLVGQLLAGELWIQKLNLFN